MNVSEKLGVAVVGLGVGQQHLRTYLRLKECSVRWIFDQNTTKAKSTIQDLDGCQNAACLEDILCDRNVDIVSIASYDADHYEQVLAVLQSGKHVFVEKPLCCNLQELKAIKKAWSASNGKLKLTSNLVLRAARLYQWLKETIESGDLGEIYAFDGDYLYGRLDKITDGWRKTEKDYSVMLGGSIHLIDLMLWLTNQKPTNVHSVGNRICTRETSFKYNDYVSSTFSFESGLIGRITANFGCVHRHHHVIRIFGTRATFIYDDKGPRLHQNRDPMLLSVPVDYPPLPKTKGDLIPDFVVAISQDLDWTNHTQKMFDTISVCIACDCASDSYSAQEIEYI